MLNESEVMATVAVRDLAPARAFYDEGKLGLQPATQEPGMAAYRCKGSTLTS